MIIHVSRKFQISFTILFTLWWTVCSGEITRQTIRVAPGIEHHSLTITETPLTIDVLTIQWPQPDVNFEAAIATDSINGSQVEYTTSLAREKDAPAHRVVAAVNGDFFHIGESGLPVNIHVQDGEIITNPTIREAFAITQDKKVFIGNLRFRGTLATSDSQAHEIAGVNIPRGEDQLVLYNRYNGKTTETNMYGTELLVKPLDPWQITMPVRGRIIDRKIGQGNMALGEANVVLSGHHRAGIFLNNQVAIGDTVSMVLRLLPEIGQITDAIGGGPLLIKNGKVVAPDDVRHPRAGIGINRDTSAVYLFTVDGRSEASAGMTLYELGKFLRDKFNLWQALNLDGGGSTTMVIWDTIVNTPSDPTGERPVGNALLLISSAPDSVLSKYPRRYLGTGQ